MSTTVFDRLARRYDALWTNTAIGRAQRNAVWHHVDALFPARSRLLDIGCGTGEDAAHFAARGVTVHATDASPAMIQIAEARGGFTTAVCDARELAQLDGTFDGALSNFGALNCVEDLPAVATSLAGLVCPGGQVAICLLGKFCAWETLHFAIRRQWGRANRRWRDAQYQGVTVHYPSVSQVRSAFAYDFELRRWLGIGLLVPPSYVNLPSSLVCALAACDRLLAGLPILRGWADHRLFLLVRK